MNIVDLTGLSYGKVYRIFNGAIDKPTPNSLKLLAKALQLDYSYLFQKAGYFKTPSKKKESNGFLMPLLSWEFCYLAFPFQEPLSSGLSDEHIPYHRNIKDGFAIIIDKKHALSPLFSYKDKLICDPHITPKNNDVIIYINTQTNTFNYGIYKNSPSKCYISSLHPNNYDDIYIEDALQPITLGTIIVHQKS
tara:strand:- start:4801 stop:5376 length:576 start_codon:yes stop_codon:yes gene_type:complete